MDRDGGDVLWATDLRYAYPDAPEPALRGLLERDEGATHPHPGAPPRPRPAVPRRAENGLDPANTRTVVDLVRERREAGATVVLTTHDMAVADRLCDRVAFIVDGRLPVVDAPKALKLVHGRRRVRVEYRADGTLESRTFPLDGLDEAEEFRALLRRGVETIHTEEATLEEVFVGVTGRDLA